MKFGKKIQVVWYGPRLQRKNFWLFRLSACYLEVAHTLEFNAAVFGFGFSVNYYLESGYDRYMKKKADDTGNEE